MHTQKKLFTPIQIGPITLKHRVVMPPMSRLRAQWPSGIPSDLQLEYYRQRASDGGLIFTEATAISTSGRGYKGAPDGMRFYVPINILAADYSHELQGRGVKLYAHTSNNCFRINQQPIPCRLREAAFALDGLLEHDTELDPRVCYTDTHGYTEVVMGRAAVIVV